MEEFVKNTVDQIGYSLIGAYLRGASGSDDPFPKKVKNSEIGLEVVGESYIPSGDNPLVTTRFNSPAISCGVLSNLITSCKERVKSYAEKAEMFANGNYEKAKKVTEDYARKVLLSALPIAYGEGADDDELKQDIRVLLRESKEEFEKRVTETEKEKAEEKEESTSDDVLSDDGEGQDVNSTGEESEEGAADMGSEEFGDNQGIETENPEDQDETSQADDLAEDNNDSDSDDDDENDITPDDEYETSDWDGEADDDTEEEPTNTFDDNSSDDDSDEDENDITPKDEGTGEMYNFANIWGGIEMNDEMQKTVDEYNRTRAFGEEQRFFYKGAFIGIEPTELKEMSKELLNRENKNFIALSESFSPSEMVNLHGVATAHQDYVRSQASLMAFQRKLGIKRYI